jgi:hypothetical protein
MIKPIKIIKKWYRTICYTKSKKIYYWNDDIIYDLWSFAYSVRYDETALFTPIEKNLISRKEKKSIITSILCNPIILFNGDELSKKPFCLFESNWNSRNHKYTTDANKLIIKTFLILTLKNENNKPKYEESLLYLLPRDMIIEILGYLFL